MLYKFFQKTRGRGNNQNLLYQVSTILIYKARHRHDLKTTKQYLMNIDPKLLNKISANQ